MFYRKSFSLGTPVSSHGECWHGGFELACNWPFHRIAVAWPDTSLEVAGRGALKNLRLDHLNMRPLQSEEESKQEFKMIIMQITPHKIKAIHASIWHLKNGNHAKLHRTQPGIVNGYNPLYKETKGAWKLSFRLITVCGWLCWQKLSIPQ